MLERLSPPEQGDLGTLKPGKTTRIPFDSREFPTIKHPYGEIPIIHASAGIKRILSLAYMITWLWSEHQINAENVQRPHQKRLVVLVDEMEAHLHPQWQRVILPALLEVQKELSSELEMQLMVATHSPLVVASLETEFDHERDKLFHLDIAENGRSRREVELKEVPFIKRGRADLWLMSDIFGLKQPRSLQAEKAIEEATALQLQEKAEPEEVRRVNTELLKTLAQDDEFWPLWRYFAKQNGLTK